MPRKASTLVAAIVFLFLPARSVAAGGLDDPRIRGLESKVQQAIVKHWDYIRSRHDLHPCVKEELENDVITKIYEDHSRGKDIEHFNPAYTVKTLLKALRRGSEQDKRLDPTLFRTIHEDLNLLEFQDATQHAVKVLEPREFDRANSTKLAPFVANVARQRDNRDEIFEPLRKYYPDSTSKAKEILSQLGAGGLKPNSLSQSSGRSFAYLAEQQQPSLTKYLNTIEAVEHLQLPRFPTYFINTRSIRPPGMLGLIATLGGAAMVVLFRGGRKGHGGLSPESDQPQNGTPLPTRQHSYAPRQSIQLGLNGRGGIWLPNHGLRCFCSECLDRISKGMM
jgi:hypothetical protein